MTSIATSHSALTIQFDAPDSPDEHEMLAAWATGSAAADLAREYLAEGGNDGRVVGLVLDTVSTGSSETGATALHLMACARALHEGATFDELTLSALEELCDFELGNDAPMSAICAGYMLDVRGGRAGADALPALVRQVAMLAPFVDDEGAASKRGKVLLNALRTLRAAQ